MLRIQQNNQCNISYSCLVIQMALFCLRAFAKIVCLLCVGIYVIQTLGGGGGGGDL